MTTDSLTKIGTPVIEIKANVRGQPLRVGKVIHKQSSSSVMVRWADGTVSVNVPTRLLDHHKKSRSGGVTVSDKSGEAILKLIGKKRR